MTFFDGHMHSTCSDGNLSPEDLVEVVKQNGVAFMALTDHDTVAGCDRARVKAEALGIGFCTGVEMSVDHNGREIHVLCYFFGRKDFTDPDGRAFFDALNASAALRRAHLLTQLEKLKANGIELTREEVLAQAGDDSIGRPHIAKAMVKRGYVASVDEAFSRFIGNGKPAHAPRQHVAATAMIALATKAGGRCSTAHPGLYGLEEKDFLELKAAGLFGIECYHHEHDAQKMLYYLRTAEKLGLVPTGGSDFHASPDRPLLKPGAQGLDQAAFERLSR